MREILNVPVDLHPENLAYFFHGAERLSVKRFLTIDFRFSSALRLLRFQQS